jgi:hypothetical protein
MTAKGPVNGPTTPSLTVDFSAAVTAPARGRAHSNTAASRGVHEFMITLLASVAARPSGAITHSDQAVFSSSMEEDSIWRLRSRRFLRR